MRYNHYLSLTIIGAKGFLLTLLARWAVAISRTDTFLLLAFIGPAFFVLLAACSKRFGCTAAVILLTEGRKADLPTGAIAIGLAYANFGFALIGTTLFVFLAARSERLGRTAAVIFLADGRKTDLATGTVAIGLAYTDLGFAFIGPTLFVFLALSP